MVRGLEEMFADDFVAVNERKASKSSYMFYTCVHIS